jgi:peptidoglycan/LPS O-acetylase OafA/YrhL
MFFVLSGLVLSLKYFSSGHKPDLTNFNPTGYLIGRAFRIWLPYGIILLISAALFHYATQSPMIKTPLPSSIWISEMWHGHPLTFSDMIRESFLIKLPEMIVLIPQSWTLTIELVLSLLLPIGLLLAEKGTNWLIFFGLFAVSCLGVSVFLLHFLLGFLIARYYPYLSGYLAGRVWQRRLICAIGVLCYASGNVICMLTGDSTIELVNGIGSALLLVFVIGSVRAQRFLSYPVLTKTGKVSYSAYLIHMLILICLTPHLLKWLELLTTDHFGLWCGGYLLTILIVQALSLLSYEWLERPSVEMGRRISDRIQSFSL